MSVPSIRTLLLPLALFSLSIVVASCGLESNTDDGGKLTREQEVLGSRLSGTYQLKLKSCVPISTGSLDPSNFQQPTSVMNPNALVELQVDGSRLVTFENTELSSGGVCSRELEYQLRRVSLNSRNNTVIPVDEQGLALRLLKVTCSPDCLSEQQALCDDLKSAARQGESFQYRASVRSSLLKLMDTDSILRDRLCEDGEELVTEYIKLI